MRENSEESNGLDVSTVEDHSTSISETNLANSENLLHFACTNARPIVEKIDSLITLFEESSLHFAILTETWLTKRHCPPRVLNDLTVGANISFIRRDRGRRGGGVAIYAMIRVKYACLNSQ